MNKINFFHNHPEESIGFLFWQVSNTWQRNIIQALKPTGLTHVQFVLLAVTAWNNQQGNIISQAFLADQAKTDVMMTSKVVRFLEQKGLLRRKEHPTDSRAYALHVTSQGLKKVDQAMPLVVDADRQFFEVLKKKQDFFQKTMINLLSWNEK